MKGNIKTSGVTVGVVGLGLMGRSIVTALLLSGHRVKAIAPVPQEINTTPKLIAGHLKHCQASGLLCKPIAFYLSQLFISENYGDLSDCKLVLECVVEIAEIKHSVYDKITREISAEAVIGSNTSAIPISKLQRFVSHPERFLGIHWAEPAYLTRFLEITCGELTSPKHAEWILELSHHWGKEPTLLRKDIRGFVTNRLMYAVYREIFHLVETHQATIEDADKAFKYDAGSWITLMGIFRRMDFLGLEDFAKIFRNLFPKLSNDDGVPELMREMIRIKARGTQNATGLYTYTKEEAQYWDEAFASFNRDIYKLAAEYPSESLTKTRKF